MEEERRRTKSAAAPGVFALLWCLAAVVIIILRIFGVIRWSWWLATALVWSPAVLIVLAIIVGYIAFRIQIRREKKGKK